MKNNKHRYKPGFTLVELMVVLAIIGILTTIVTVNVFKTKDVASIQAAEVGIKAIKSALGQYEMIEKKYPKDLEELKRGKYITGKLKDPWGTKYNYIPNYGDDGERVVSYVVFSSGPDRRKDTEDDIGNPLFKKDE